MLYITTMPTNPMWSRGEARQQLIGCCFTVSIATISSLLCLMLKNDRIGSVPYGITSSVAVEAVRYP